MTQEALCSTCVSPVQCCDMSHNLLVLTLVSLLSMSIEDRNPRNGVPTFPKKPIEFHRALPIILNFGNDYESQRAATVRGNWKCRILW